MKSETKIVEQQRQKFIENENQISNKKKISAIILTVVSVLIVVFFILSKIKLYNTTPAGTGVDYSQYTWYMIPVMYVINYLKNAWISLLMSFLLAGIIQEFIPDNVIQKYLGGSKIYHYFLAAALAPLFITCSCSVIPIYVSIILSGASLGVAMTFFLMAPAANFITIMMTGEYIGWDLGIWRLVFSFIAAVICGIVFDRTKVSKEIAKKYEEMRVGKANKMLTKKSGFERVLDMWSSSWELMKKIIPYLIAGLVVVSYIAAFLPEEWITLYFTGIPGIIIAALLGGPLYTPTLVEIVLTQTLLEKGMSRPTALSFMMGQPYDFVSMVPNSKYFKWTGVLLYTGIFFLFSILSGILMGLVTGSF